MPIGAADEQALVRSANEKSRLKWTPQLHERFIDAVSQLGGADKATPKSVMRAMGVPCLTLYHLKSHLQKYRLAMNHKLKQDGVLTNNVTRYNHIQSQLDISMLHMQMEVQKKLQEQIEVQKHLQLRIEAQGKYLQSVLRKAQEALAGSRSSSAGVTAKNEECLGSPMYELNLSQARKPDCSTDSCLTSIETPEFRAGDRRRACVEERGSGERFRDQRGQEELDLNR